MSSLAHDKQDMQRGWNARAVRNPFFYVETTHWDGDIGRFFELGEASARRLIDPVLQRRAPARDLALDLGCGLGRFSRALARRFSSVMAVDVSDRMIAEAKRLQSDGEFKNITFEKSDGVILPAAKNAVDFVWSYEVFQHIPTRQSIAANLDEIARVLRPGGIAMNSFEDRISTACSSRGPAPFAAMGDRNRRTHRRARSLDGRADFQWRRPAHARGDSRPVWHEQALGAGNLSRSYACSWHTQLRHSDESAVGATCEAPNA